MTHARTHTHIQVHSRAPTLAQTLTRSTRSLHRPGCCVQSCTTAVESAADACMDPGIDQPPQSAAAPLFAQQTNNCSKLCPMDVAVTSVRRLGRLRRFADSGQACPCRLSICLLLGCAGHSWPSDPSRPARTGHANKCSASRIRRGSRTHLAEASALGGPRKDRLYRDGSLRW